MYSPSSRRADTMAQRLREMRAQRENLSPSGMSTCFVFSFRCLQRCLMLCLGHWIYFIFIFPLTLGVFESRVSCFIQLFFSSASQTLSSPMDDSLRPSLGDTPTDLYKLFLGEAIYRYEYHIVFHIQLKARIQ